MWNKDSDDTEEVMWCGHDTNDKKERLQDLIDYFEGTCEYCIANMGMESYVDEIVQMIHENGDTEDEISMMTHYTYGVMLYKQEKLEEAACAWRRAEQIAQKIEHREFLAKNKSYLAIYYYVKRDFAVSNRYFKEAEDIFKELELYTELALHYINILWYKRYEEDEKAVLEYMDRAFDYVQMSASRRDARIYLHLGYIYKTIFGDFVRGIKYFCTAGEMCHGNENVEMETMTIHVMADGYMQLEHFEEAIAIYTYILQHERYRSVTPNLQCMMLSNLIYCYFRTGMLEEADRMIQRMRLLVPETLVNMRGQFFCVSTWLQAKLAIAGKDYLDMVPEELQECKDIYDENKENFYISDFDYKLSETSGDYYMALKDAKKAVGAYLYQEALAEKYGKLAENRAWQNLAEAYQAAGEKEKAEMYRARAQEVDSQVENANLVEYYNRIFRKIFQEQ